VSVRILEGDALAVLPTLGAGSVQMCVTSPPYWGLRDYGHAGQLGLERTPEEYVARMVAVFADVRRVLRDDGTLWLNLGDSYAGAPVGSFNGGGFKDASAKSGGRDLSGVAQSGRLNKLAASGLKAKDLVGIPWRVAFALQADGWYLRSDIIWSKPNPMPESVTDRPTKAHEYVFLLSKSERYAYDADAIKEPATDTGRENGRDGRREDPRARPPGSNPRTLARIDFTERGRNARSVWTVATQPYRGAHFATMPPELARRCILAGCPVGGTVLDPFGGAGTTGLVADRLGRDAVLVELNPEYAALARRRILGDNPLFGDVA
jgi:DNA modification methylase